MVPLGRWGAGRGGGYFCMEICALGFSKVYAQVYSPCILLHNCVRVAKLSTRIWKTEHTDFKTESTDCETEITE